MPDLGDRRALAHDLLDHRAMRVLQMQVVDAAAPVANDPRVSPHVAHAGDAICHEQLTDRISDVGPCRVDVHVPKTRDEKLAAADNDLRVRGHLQRVRSADAHDAIPPDDDGSVGTWRSAGDVDDRHVRDRDRGRRGKRGCTRRRRAGDREEGYHETLAGPTHTPRTP